MPKCLPQFKFSLRTYVLLIACFDLFYNSFCLYSAYGHANTSKRYFGGHYHRFAITECIIEGMIILSDILAGIAVISNIAGMKNARVVQVLLLPFMLTHITMLIFSTVYGIWLCVFHALNWTVFVAVCFANMALDAVFAAVVYTFMLRLHLHGKIGGVEAYGQLEDCERHSDAVVDNNDRL